MKPFLFCMFAWMTFAVVLAFALARAAAKPIPNRKGKNLGKLLRVNGCFHNFVRPSKRTSGAGTCRPRYPISVKARAC